jgi:hypothetical protein
MARTTTASDSSTISFVDAVAVGAFAAFPESFGGFAFHSGDDAVDDGVAFELGEHAQHLYEHAAHGGGGVEWFGGGPEYDPGAVQLIEQRDQVAEVAENRSTL